MQKKRPNTFLIGVQKGGTTSLYTWLAQHPDIYAPPAVKDFPFFCYDPYYLKGTDWFASFFKDHAGEKVILQGSVNYLYDYKTSAERLYSYDKDCKFIVCLRNPVERAYSAFWEMKKMGLEKYDTFEDALQQEGKRLSGSIDERLGLTYIDHGFYYKQLEYFLTYFKKHQFIVILFENLIRNPEEVVKLIFQFLAINDTFLPEFSVENVSGKPRSKRVQQLLSRRGIFPSWIKNILPLDRRILIKRLIMNKNIKQFKYPPMSSVTREKLQKIFSEDIQKMQTFLSIDVSHWNIT